MDKLICTAIKEIVIIFFTCYINIYYIYILYIYYTYISIYIYIFIYLYFLYIYFYIFLYIYFYAIYIYIYIYRYIYILLWPWLPYIYILWVLCLRNHQAIYKKNDIMTIIIRYTIRIPKRPFVFFDKLKRWIYEMKQYHYLILILKECKIKFLFQ